MARDRSRSPLRGPGEEPEVRPEATDSKAEVQSEERPEPTECERLGGLVWRPQGSTLNFDALSVSCSSGEDWVAKGAEIFDKYRVLIVRDMFSKETTDAVLRSCQDLHANWSAKYDKELLGNRMPGRYELMDAYDCWHLTHLPGYLEALEELVQKGGLRFLSAIGDKKGYKFVGGHAHLCLAQTHNEQPLHSDFVHPGPREMKPLWEAPEHVPFIDWMFTLHPLTSKNAALRILPGVPSTASTYWQFATEDDLGQGVPPPKLFNEPDAYKRAGLYDLPAGCAILRDLRIWHGGTPNTSDTDRYTAVLRFYSMWANELWKDNAYERPGIDPQDLERKLSPEAREVVSPHLVRNTDPGKWCDPPPRITEFAGWHSTYDSWKHATTEGDSKAVGVKPYWKYQDGWVDPAVWTAQKWEGWQTSAAAEDQKWEAQTWETA